MRRACLVAMAMCLSSVPANAQRRALSAELTPTPFTIAQGPSSFPSAAPSTLGESNVRQLAGRELAGQSRSKSAWAILASALVPGAGQAALKQWRALAYVGLEGYAWSAYASDSRGARRDRDAYRQLSLNVARAPFNGSKAIDDFEYYERMENYQESGRFSLGPESLLLPETDSTTFNGAMWLLARRTYWKDPTVAPARGSTEWLRAESFYLSRAVRPEYLWSWKGAPTAYDQFRRLIRGANQGYRDAITDLGVVLGNHFLSTVDAYVTVQVRRRSTALLGRTYEVSVAVPF